MWRWVKAICSAPRRSVKKRMAPGYCPPNASGTSSSRRIVYGLMGAELNRLLACRSGYDAAHGGRGPVTHDSAKGRVRPLPDNAGGWTSFGGCRHGGNGGFHGEVPHKPQAAQT